MAKNSDLNIHEMANYFAEKTGILIPKEVLDFYSLHENENMDLEFVRLFKHQYESIKDGGNPYISVLISEKLAIEIVKLCMTIPEHNRIEILFDKIKNHSFNKIGEKMYFKNDKLYNSFKNKPIEEDYEEFVLDEILYSVNDYDFRNNRFNFSLIQQAYENIGSEINNIKAILILWVHCGGEGGIIVKGKNVGYETGYAHIDDLDLNFNGKNIKYRGFLHEENEKIYTEIDKKRLKEKRMPTMHIFYVSFLLILNLPN
tara:strand:+ start:525 stop:1298 length:774 start_codon:yes stop_codon:yes gene_type:complete